MPKRLRGLEVDDQLKAGRLLDRHVGWFGGVVLESAIAAIRRAPDTASMRMSWRLPSSSGDKRLMPVMLPPGRASDATRPSPTMSSDMPMSGMVRVTA